MQERLKSQLEKVLKPVPAKADGKTCQTHKSTTAHLCKAILAWIIMHMGSYLTPKEGNGL